MLLRSGIYIITNVEQNRSVYLEDANDNSPLRGHHRPDGCTAQWRLQHYGKEEYTIQNVAHNRYANSGPLAGLKTVIEGNSRDQIWRIRMRSTGEYTIATIDNANVWMLAYNEPDTSVWLSCAHADPRCWWDFTETQANLDDDVSISKHADSSGFVSTCVGNVPHDGIAGLIPATIGQGPLCETVIPTIPRMMQPQRPSQAPPKMGIQVMVEHATENIMTRNSSNTRTGRLLADRATDIARDLEHSGDPDRGAKLQHIIADVAAEFERDDLQSQTDPLSFLKRQNAIMQADAQLDFFKNRAPSRDSVMKEAAEKDMRRLGLNLSDLCQSSLPLIKELCDMLPNRKILKEIGVSDEILAGKELFSKLQIAMAQFNRKILALQELGPNDFKIMIMILRLEDPDADARYLHCGIEATFGELLQKAFLPDPESLPSASQDENDDEDDEDPIPDVWVRKFDAARNSITETGQWWEHQLESLKICDAFSTSGERSKGEQKQWVVEVVERKGDYVVALVKDNKEEMGKVVDLPNTTRRRHDTTEHIRKIFPDRKVAKVLELQSGKNAPKMFNKLSYQPRTNKLYIELEPV